MSSLKKIEIYKIIVHPYSSAAWEGLFNFHPNSEDVAIAIQEDVAIAIQQDVDKLNEDRECDKIRSLKHTLELVTYRTSEFLGRVSVAGTYIGEISIEIIKVFTEGKPLTPVCTPAPEETWKKALHKPVEDSDKAILTCRGSVCVE